ncbi:hypothetical protein NUW54_g14562 [Trametes sanguinea]|uniref:Uncharacterized protein n=1 Tax=Trametes sanguinea TaxID=158606 RepID=A0ACC1MBG1_9APHY|nr:hypothetical protein NUW54_g14562 [Trametes sanguinea]
MPPPPPPVRRESADSVRSARSQITSPPPHPPIPVRRDSHQEAVQGSPSLHATSPREDVPGRRESVGSVRSGTGVEAPAREASQDDRDDRAAAAAEGDVNADDEEAEAHEQRRPAAYEEAHEEALSEVAEDEEAETRAEHEDLHASADELAYEGHEGNNAEADDYRIAHERQEEPEPAEEVAVVAMRGVVNVTGERERAQPGTDIETVEVERSIQLRGLSVRPSDVLPARLDSRLKLKRNCTLREQHERLNMRFIQYRTYATAAYERSFYTAHDSEELLERPAFRAAHMAAAWSKVRYDRAY